jgi:hypothetical protein
MSRGLWIFLRSCFVKQNWCIGHSVRPNKFLDAAFHHFDGGNKKKEVRVRTSTVKRGLFLESR